MKAEDAKKTWCCQTPEMLCKGSSCMSWLGSRPDSDDGQCIWICTCFTIIKAMTPKGQSPIIKA